MERPGRWLKVAFGTGAVTEAFVLVPMLMPPMARLLWGLDNSVPTCYVALGGTLPTLATNKTMKRATAKLQRSYRRLGKGLNRAASSPSKKQPKRYRTTRKLVQKLATAAERDSGKGTLGVSLPAVQGAATALLAEIPF
jgi:hypothetical protein